MLPPFTLGESVVCLPQHPGPPCSPGSFRPERDQAHPGVFGKVFIAVAPLL
jgi:hypothetical protein